MFSITLSDRLNKQNSHTNETLIQQNSHEHRKTCRRVNRVAVWHAFSRAGLRVFAQEFHGNPKEARADFVRFLSGELPARLRKEAQLWISEEQGCMAPTLIDEDDLVGTSGRFLPRPTSSK